MFVHIVQYKVVSHILLFIPDLSTEVSYPMLNLYTRNFLDCGSLLCGFNVLPSTIPTTRNIATRFGRMNFFSVSLVISPCVG